MYAGATHPHAAAEPTPRRLAWAASVVALVLCALMAYWLWVLRDHRLQFTARQLVLQTAALSEHVRVVFDTVDASLRATRADLAAGRITPDSAQARLRLRAGDDLYVRELALATANGTIVASSSAASSAARALPPGDPPGALRIGPPRSGDAESIELARSAAADAGALQIIAVADARFIERFFARVAIASDARFGLYTLAGQRLAGNLDLAELEEADVGAAALLEHLLEPNTPVAHARVFATAQRLRGLPLVAISSRDRSAVLAPWVEYLASATLVTVIALGLLAFVVLRLQHETQARVQAQAVLARRAEQSRRLEALGRLSGGIAHDFNNVLAAILGYADLLGQQVAANTPAARSAEQVLRAGERGRRLVARILSFSRGGPKPQTAVAVLPVVREVLDLLAATLPATIRLERAFDAGDTVTVRGDAIQLFEAVHNLCTNALQAMPDGGVLRVVLAVEAAVRDAATADERVVLRIEDTGHGLSNEATEHLFEPFFTTRAGAGGTGLGLAIVHAAVKDMGGTIDVQSAPNRGTTFTLAFPRIEAAPPREAEAPADVPRGHGQVVMVVDDEPALVALTEEVLAGMGYEPAGYADPQAALAALQETPERYDALLVDQAMPGLNGTDLARRFRALRPDVPILLVSGYGGTNLDERARAAGVSTVLQKPLHRAELGARLAQAFAR
ncbi:MAG: response regulator [Proteobacteria bacterium]|nr:response regulator [Pseudomonadota bacterium]